MEDMGSEKEFFKEKFMANVVNKMGDATCLLDYDDLEILEGDVKVSTDGPYPKIFFSEHVHEILDKSMEQIVVVRFLGRTIELLWPWMPASGWKCQPIKLAVVTKNRRNLAIDKETPKNTQFDILTELEEPNFTRLSGYTIEMIATVKEIKNGKQINKTLKPDILVLMETRVSGRKADDIIQRTSFDFLYRVEMKGFSRAYNCSFFGHIGRKKRVLMARLKGIEDKLIEKQLRSELEEVLTQEASLWKQKA
ncbi:hypothetical protein GOBAR_DD09705 [Gossypium barbadense]|nr:hypothetical protein GOBAR_DD09705 [Gossypium barbadense]